MFWFQPCPVVYISTAIAPTLQGYMPSSFQRFDIILNNHNTVPSLTYLSLDSQMSGSWALGALQMSELKQNNKRLSRLAIISKHVAAHRREHFGTVWVDFWRAGSFFGTCLFCPNVTLRHMLSPAPSGVFILFESQRCCVDFGVYIFFSYANGGCSVTWWGPNVALKMLITFDRWWELCVPGNSANGHCPTRLTSMSVWADGYCNKKKTFINEALLQVTQD